MLKQFFASKKENVACVTKNTTGSVREGVEGSVVQGSQLIASTALQQ
jgi:hypothetical protein